MPHVTYKRLAKHGNSLLVPIPALMCRALSWLRGDFVELLLDDAAGTITLRATHPRTEKLDPPEKPQGVAELS